MYHGTQPDITEALVHCKLYDVVISGHTHTAFSSREQNTLWVNPGSAHGFDDAPTAAIYDTNEMRHALFSCNLMRLPALTLFLYNAISDLL